MWCFCNTAYPGSSAEYPPHWEPRPCSCLSPPAVLSPVGRGGQGCVRHICVRHPGPECLRADPLWTISCFSHVLVLGIFKILLPSLKNAWKVTLSCSFSKGAVLDLIPVMTAESGQSPPSKDRDIVFERQQTCYAQPFFNLIIKEAVYFIMKTLQLTVQIQKMG